MSVANRSTMGSYLPMKRGLKSATLTWRLRERDPRVPIPRTQWKLFVALEESERLFQAIKGNGGIARLVMLPRESHGYRARESVLHVQAETIDWFDRHVKG